MDFVRDKGDKETAVAEGMVRGLYRDSQAHLARGCLPPLLHDIVDKAQTVVWAGVELGTWFMWGSTTELQIQPQSTAFKRVLDMADIF